MNKGTKAFVIMLKGNHYSEMASDHCVETASKHGLKVDKWNGINKDIAIETMNNEGLEWGWADNNRRNTVCPHTGLHQFPYMNGNKPAAFEPKVGCAMSHYTLWKKCSELNEPIVILEHDAVFINDFPHDVEFNGIMMINDPTGATPRGDQWANHMKKRGPGVFPKTWIRSEEERKRIPDGLAGHSAYIIKPWAAQEVMNKAKEIGMWHNDALVNRQIFPYLEEHYPFITKVVQTESTSVK